MTGSVLLLLHVNIEEHLHIMLVGHVHKANTLRTMQPVIQFCMKKRRFISCVQVLAILPVLAIISIPFYLK